MAQGGFPGRGSGEPPGEARPPDHGWPVHSSKQPDRHQWERIPAKLWWGRPQFIHLFEQQRPNQTRGMSFSVAMTLF